MKIATSYEQNPKGSLSLVKEQLNIFKQTFFGEPEFIDYVKIPLPENSNSDIPLIHPDAEKSVLSIFVCGVMFAVSAIVYFCWQKFV